MPRYVYRPDHPEADEFGMVDSNKAGPKGGENAPYVISDEMPSTRHMADGKNYTSKAKFRAATRAAGCVEVGNETSTLLKSRQTPKMSKEQRIRDIRVAIEQLRSR